ncbi:probable assembly chaperone of rpl4 [Strongylocentrotus purpuratus]|uniref:Assembly chaperone of rpl4 n=1 Tax=Strongylocentrotus purpuratus TaxID=7668 RepID=A0A7M7GJW3_STRPU|nr:probable assembly chaperone of rpl4 [Strongylocentrotus purpuratus]
MGGSKAQRRKRGKHSNTKSRKNEDGTSMSRQEFQDLVEQRRQEKKATKKTSSQFSIDQLLEKVDEYLDTFEYEMAQKFCQRALQMEPDNVRALESSGNLLAELGDTDGARKCFGRAITVCPEEGFSKYMYMGQLHEGLEGLQFFQKGVELMIKERDGEQKEESGASCSSESSASKVTNADICRAYCSIAEIFLTDACFEEDSDERCKAAIDQAVNEDPHSPEAHQLLASYWLSKDNKQEAIASMKKSLSLWQYLEGDGEGGGSNDDIIVEPILSYENRIGAAKILMELEMWDESENVLHTLLEEDDEVVQVWYMLGLVQHERGLEQCKPQARYYLHKAKKLYCALSCDDEEVLVHIDELLTSLGPGEGDQDDWMERQGKEEEEEEDEEDGDIDSEASSDEEEEEEEEMEH